MFMQALGNFTFYDYNEPEAVPKELHHSFGVVIADPPYLVRHTLPFCLAALRCKFFAHRPQSEGATEACMGAVGGVSGEDGSDDAATRRGRRQAPVFPAHGSGDATAGSATAQLAAGNIQATAHEQAGQRVLSLYKRHTIPTNGRLGQGWQLTLLSTSHFQHACVLLCNSQVHLAAAESKCIRFRFGSVVAHWQWHMCWQLLI